MTVRHSTAADLPALRGIYAAARAFMKATGNPHQWGDTKPTEEMILSDIDRGVGYVVEEAGRPCGAFAFIEGIDPTYGVIDGGAWLNDAPYGTIHRIASDGTARGVLAAALAFGAQRVDNIRIDTHADNRVMQHLLDTYGFTRCGVIYLENGDPRLAYQKVIR